MMSRKQSRSEACPLREEDDEVGNPNLSMSTSSMPSILTSARTNAVKRAEKLGKLVAGEGGPVDIDAKIIHKYDFMLNGKRHELCLSHAQSVWNLKSGSEVIASKTHSNSALKSFRTSLIFDIPEHHIATGEPASFIHARMTMEWIPRSMKWQYTLIVRDTEVPPYWSKS